MNIFEGADRFELYDDLIFNEKIEAVFADLVIFVKEGDCFLSDELDPAKRELNRERLFVNRFKKPRAEFAVDPNRGRDNSLRRFTIPQLPSCFPAFLIHFQMVPAAAVSSRPGLRFSGMVSISA